MNNKETKELLSKYCEKNGENTYSLGNFVFDIHFDIVNVHKSKTLELLISFSNLNNLSMFILSINNEK